MQTSSLAALAQHIGQYAQFRTSDGLMMTVQIVDIKQAWGNDRYVICDTNGTQITVAATRVKINEVAA